MGPVGDVAEEAEDHSKASSESKESEGHKHWGHGDGSGEILIEDFTSPNHPWTTLVSDEVII